MKEIGTYKQIKKINEGKYRYKCSVCGKEYDITKEALEHHEAEVKRALQSKCNCKGRVKETKTLDSGEIIETAKVKKPRAKKGSAKEE